ncbi:MAG: hypothetical protein JJU10_08535 [Idiomarina sp.]|nr:hypothetical protein [Idiomarina sp.]
MKRGLQFIATLSLAAALSACAYGPNLAGQEYDSRERRTEVTRHEVNGLNASTAEFSRLIAQSLYDSARGIESGQRVAITSLTWLDSGLNQTSILGHQLQEELAVELHRLDLTVVEYKLTGAIRVTPDGDFALSRNYLELPELQHVDFILAGTLLQHDDGVVVNARLIDTQSRAIAATARIHVPADVAGRYRGATGVELVRGAR